MAVDFGTDLLCFGDLDPQGRLVSGFPCLQQDLLHRISTARGTLIGDPNYGIDVRDYLGRPFSQALANEIAGDVTAELSKEKPRIKSVSATATFTPGLKQLQIAINGQTANGPFNTVFGVAQSGVSVLS